LIFKLISQSLYNIIRAIDIGLINLPLGERLPLARVVEARTVKKTSEKR
jgi:hypothetical protein